MGSSAPAPRTATGALALLLLVCAAGAAGAQNEFERGLELFESGAYAEAERVFEQAARAQPGDARALYYAGLAASKQDDPARAVEAFERAADLDPDLPHLQASLGVAYYEIGELGNAAAHLERAHAADSSDGSALYFLGLLDWRYARYERAIDRFERAAEADPEFAALAWYSAGRSQRALGNEALAQEAFRRAIELDEDGDIAADAGRMLMPSDYADRRDKRWSLRASAGFEGDSNLTVSELDGAADEGDVGIMFALSTDIRVFERGATEVEVGYDFYQSLYSDRNDLNLRTHTPYVTVSSGVGAIDPSLTYRFSHSKLGGDNFLDVHTAAFGVGRSLTSWWYGLAAYDIEGLVYEEDTGRDALRNDGRDVASDALRNVFRVEQFFASSDERFSAFLGWRIERNEAEDAEFDYLGNTLRVQLEMLSHIGRDESRLELGYEYRARGYDEPTTDGDGNPLTGGEKREDRRHTGWAELTMPLVEHLDGVVRFTQIGSLSNLRSQDFDESVISCRLELWF
jgi:tetratricopeptide (TPR) repeat protein